MATSSLRVLSIGHSYVVRMNRGILREIAADKSYDVTVVGPESFQGSLRPLSFEPEPAGSPLKVQTLPAYWTQKMHFFAYDPRALKKIFSQKYDVLHLWEEPYIFAGYQVARQAKRSSVPFCVRTAQSLVKKYPFPFCHFEKKVFHWSKDWVAGGQLVHEAMVKKGWARSCRGGTKGQVLSLAVDTNEFKPYTSSEKVEKQKELGLSGPVLGFLGRLEEEKGLDLLMTSLESLRDQPWSFLVMGAGSYQAKIEKWAHDQGFSHRVQVRLLKHNEVPGVLPACDLLLCPSQTRSFWKEQFGRMIVEAFAAGVPVLGSDSGEIPRVIGEAGGILPENQPHRWTEEIHRLIGDPKDREQWKDRGLLRAEEFSAKALAEKYKKFYHQLASS